MTTFVPKADIRHAFSQAMSQMYQDEVPLYKELIELVADVNAQTLADNHALQQQLTHTGEIERIDLERHGAIRLGLPSELATMRQLFAVMGMYPVGYYDLAPSGVPVHATAFRSLDSDELQRSPFRVFCSLLRPELIDDDNLRQMALDTLHNRQIFSDDVLALIAKSQQDGGLNADDAKRFVNEAIKTFQWHKTSPISQAFYNQLLSQHRLIADVVGFYGPHINHLTPRTLDIDQAQQEMIRRGMAAKEIIEGPPRRQCPILLRQTSFKALNEDIIFTDSQAGTEQEGSHSARFGEIEQRGIALTPKGHQLYDRLLNQARTSLAVPPEKDPEAYYTALQDSFAQFPDDYQRLYDEGLAYFYYQLNDAPTQENADNDIPTLLKRGVLRLEPIVYEDFLPVSAAGIFQSNLGDDAKSAYDASSNQAAFERDLGTKVHDMHTLYQAMMDNSLTDCMAQLRRD